MNPRARLALRLGLLAVPVAAWVVAVVVSRRLTISQSWWAWMPLRDSPVALLGCVTNDTRTPVWYRTAIFSTADLFTTVPVALLGIGVVASAGWPRLARRVTRVVVALFLVELGVFANGWLERAIVGRLGLDQDPYCNDGLQISQAINRGAYDHTTVLLAVATLLAMVLELDRALSRPADPGGRPRPTARPLVVVWTLRVLLLGAVVAAFARGIVAVGSPVVVFEVGGLVLLATLTALPIALAARPAVRAVGWVSWCVGIGVAVALWCATWVIGLNHAQPEDYVPGRIAFETFSGLPDDQLRRLLGMQQVFGWWCLGLVALGLLGAVLERLTVHPYAVSPGQPRETQT